MFSSEIIFDSFILRLACHSDANPTVSFHSCGFWHVAFFPDTRCLQTDASFLAMELIWLSGGWCVYKLLHRHQVPDVFNCYVAWKTSVNMIRRGMAFAR